MIQFNAAIFAWPCVLSDRPPALWLIITRRIVGCRYMMRLGKTVEMAQLLKIKEQMPGIWTKWCVLDDCVGAI